MLHKKTTDTLSVALQVIDSQTSTDENARRTLIKASEPLALERPEQEWQVVLQEWAQRRQEVLGLQVQRVVQEQVRQVSSQVRAQRQQEVLAA